MESEIQTTQLGNLWSRLVLHPFPQMLLLLALLLILICGNFTYVYCIRHSIKLDFVIDTDVVSIAFRKRISAGFSQLANHTNRLIGYHLLPTSAGSFEDDLEDGLTSSNFDIEEHNIEEGDSRAGLKNKEEILKIMKRQGCSFDEARLIRQQRLLKKNVS